MKIEKQYSTIEILDDCVVKTLSNKKVSEEWYKTYTCFTHNKPIYTKVLDYTDNQIVMEKIDIMMPVNRYLKSNSVLNRQLCLDILSSYFQVITDCVEYSKNLKKDYWTHDDLTIDNFVITKNNSVKLIDPDSFHFCDNPVDYKYSFGVIELENLMRKI